MPVYMIRAGEHGPVKIGFAEDVVRRLGKMQADNHERLTVLRIFHGSVAEEATLHTLFAANALHGEWFSFTKAMMGDVGLTEIIAPEIAKDERTALLHKVGRFVAEWIHAPEQIRDLSWSRATTKPTEAA